MNKLGQKGIIKVLKGEKYSKKSVIRISIAANKESQLN